MTDVIVVSEVACTCAQEGGRWGVFLEGGRGHVIPTHREGGIARAHTVRIDCGVCVPWARRKGPLDTPTIVHVEPGWPGGDERDVWT